MRFLRKVVLSTSTRVFFHVTETKNVPSIKSRGLKPSIGNRSEKVGEGEPKVYLFCSEDEVDTALANWLGEEFEDLAEQRGVNEIPLTLLKVSLPDTFPVEKCEEGAWETHVYETIPPRYIKVMKEV